MTKICVIIPVYNCEAYIARAIESVLIQEEVRELILVNDGSKDKTVEICLNYVNKFAQIKLFHHPGKKNKGAAASRNLGIIMSSSPYIAFLDADDYYLPNRFFNALQVLESDNEIDGVYQKIALKEEDGTLEPYARIEINEPETLFENLQPLGNKVWFSCNGLLIRRNSMLKAGLFEKSLKTSEDTLQWFKLAATTKLIAGNLNVYVCITEKRPFSLTTNVSRVKKDFVTMLWLLLLWCLHNKISKLRCELVFKRFIYELFKPDSIINKRQKWQYWFKLLVFNPHFALTNAGFRYFTGKLLNFKN